jgi:acetyl/propionyl-CoA carboxylase alpha subunit
MVPRYIEPVTELPRTPTQKVHKHVLRERGAGADVWDREAAGTVVPAAGVLSRFQPPSGRGIRVDTHGYAGYPVNPRYDSLLAKVVVSDPRGDVRGVASCAARRR